MLEDKRLKVFAAVVEFGNFTAAASSLGLTQPAVSQNIAELEKELGVRLFERSTRGDVRITDEGRRFESYARQIMHWYKAAREAFHPSPLSVSGPEKPAVLPLDGATDALVWSSEGDLHIEIRHK
ncbi:MAG: LysR family transcriptional regulator [Bacteroidales bacterium]|nr:LysR family transcriptional regulator [Bacteroidales bacterium]